MRRFKLMDVKNELQKGDSKHSGNAKKKTLRKGNLGSKLYLFYIISTNEIYWKDRLQTINM